MGRLAFAFGRGIFLGSNKVALLGVESLRFFGFWMFFFLILGRELKMIRLKLGFGRDVREGVCGIQKSKV